MKIFLNRIIHLALLITLCSCLGIGGEEEEAGSNNSADQNSADSFDNSSNDSSNLCDLFAGSYRNFDGAGFELRDNCSFRANYCDTDGSINLDGSASSGSISITVNNTPADESYCLPQGTHNCSYSFSNDVMTLNCNGTVGVYSKYTGNYNGPSKTILDRWDSIYSSFYLDFSSLSFFTNETIYVTLPVSQDWIDYLDYVGRDTTGLYAGATYFCELDIYIGYYNSNGTYGAFATNHDDIDTPEHNACMEWDSNCAIDGCNFSADHVYIITDDDYLYINWFGDVDTEYGDENYQSVIME